MRRQRHLVMLTMIVAATHLLSPHTVLGQHDRRFVLDTVRFAFVYQSKCPIEVLDAAVVCPTTGGGQALLRLRNRGSSAVSEVVYFTIDADGGLGRKTILDFAATGCPLAPGDTSPASRDDLTSGTVTLTDSEKRSFGPVLDQTRLVLVVIARVTFADGSVYQDDETVASVRAQLDTEPRNVYPVPPN